MKRLALAISLATLSVLPAGCNIAAPVFFAIHGPPKTPAVFELDKNKATVVIVDDRSNKAPQRTLRGVIAERIETELLDRGELNDVIESRAAFRVTSEDELTDPRPIAEIGAAVGADVVIYVTLDEFSLAPQGQSSAPTAVARVKVLDLVEEKRVFPGTSSGYPVKVEMQRPGGYGATTISEKASQNNALAEALGLGIAQLFYSHERSQTVRTLGPM